MRFFRADAAFTIPELYEMLEAEGYFYAIRLKGTFHLAEVAVPGSVFGQILAAIRALKPPPRPA